MVVITEVAVKESMRPCSRIEHAWTDYINRRQTNGVLCGVLSDAADNGEVICADRTLAAGTAAVVRIIALQCVSADVVDKRDVVVNSAAGIDFKRASLWTAAAPAGS